MAAASPVDLTDKSGDSVISPPRNWPSCFKTAALQQFVASEAIKAKRVRLTAAPTVEQLQEAAGMSIVEGDAVGNATRARFHLGWQVFGGFILYERENQPAEYRVETHYWNATRRGLWVDLTPRRVHHAALVLIESAMVVVPEPTADERAAIAAAVAARAKEATRSQHTAPAETVVCDSTRKQGGVDREDKAMAQLAIMELKARQQAALDALPDDSPYTPLLRRVKMLPEQVVGAKSLDWSAKHLHAHHMRQFAQLCDKHGPLQVERLALYSNALHDEGLIALAPAFRHLPSLDSLYLQFNHIGDKGIAALCRHPPARKLDTFFCFQNDFGNAGYKALGDAFEAGRLKAKMFVCHFCKADELARERLKAQCLQSGIDKPQV